MTISPLNPVAALTAITTLDARRIELTNLIASATKSDHGKAQQSVLSDRVKGWMDEADELQQTINVLSEFVTPCDEEIEQAIHTAITEDLNTAKNRGHILIGDTRRGTLSLTYDAGHYVLRTCGMDSYIVSQGTAADIRPSLVDLYIVD